MAQNLRILRCRGNPLCLVTLLGKEPADSRNQPKRVTVCGPVSRHPDRTVDAADCEQTLEGPSQWPSGRDFSRAGLAASFEAGLSPRRPSSHFRSNVMATRRTPLRDALDRALAIILVGGAAILVRIVEKLVH